MYCRGELNEVVSRTNIRNREKKERFNLAETFLKKLGSTFISIMRLVVLERNYHTKRGRAMKISRERRGNRRKR